MNLNFFGPDSPYLGHPLLTPERTAAEVDVILDQLKIESARGLDVLDVGCGFGRHAIEFARRGANVVAVDPSSTMIDAARTQSDDVGGLAIEWRTAAADAIDDRHAFDLAICLFTTLGQLQQGAVTSQAPAVLAALMATVRPGGHVVIEVPERDRAVELLVESEALGPPGSETAVTRQFDAASSIVHERFETAAGQTFHLAYELFTQAELVDLCAAAGFVDIVTIDHALVPPPPTFVTLFASCPSG